MKTNFTDVGCPKPEAGSRAPLSGRSSETPSAAWPTLAILWLMLALLGLPPQARADLSAPDNILYGIVVLGTNQVTTNATDFVVEARRANGLPIARYRMGDRPEAGNHYVLAIKIEEIAPLRDPASVLLNETLAIVVASNSVEQVRENFTVLERGQVVQLNFGSLPTNALTGFEAWASARGLGLTSQNLDADADGVSNQREYVAGTDPKNAASRFLLRIARTNANTRVSFDALQAEGTGYDNRSRHYALEQLVDWHPGNWQPVPGYSDVVGANQTVVYEAAGADAPLFFRGKVWLDGDQGVLPGEFRLSVGRGAGQMTISFTALGPDDQGRNRYYTLERIAGLTRGAWTAVPGYSNILGNNQIVTHAISSTAGGSDFYRARLELRNP